MIESKETGTINTNNLDNVYGYYNFSTEDRYKEALEVFFHKGVSYKDRILLSSISTSTLEIANVKTIYDSDDPTYEIIFRATDKAQAEGILYLGKNIGLGDEIVYISIQYTLDFEGGTTSTLDDIDVDEEYIDVVSSEVIGDRSFKITFKVLQELVENTIFKLTTAPGYIWKLEQNKIQLEGTFRSVPPVMDCSDYVSFLWSVVNNGWIIKGKIFDCQSLLDKRFENIKFLEKIYSNNYNIKYDSYKTLLENLEVGDILVFKKEFMYHCIIITNPKTENYAECSGYLEQNLGTYYNGKLTPYPLELRFNYLKEDCDVYLCRLYLSI
jgi:hypothetical protein